MEKVAYNEVELAKRWGISPKTLQRWRSEGRGPRYLKLSKRVVYPVDEIEAYEHDALYASTWQKADDGLANLRFDARQFCSCKHASKPLPMARE